MQQIRLVDEYQQRVWRLSDVREPRLVEVGICMYGHYSILDLMKWSRLAREAGVISDAEWCEVNHLGNRMAFADDHRRPRIVSAAERARFAALARLVFPSRPADAPRRAARPAPARISRNRTSREAVYH